MSHNLKPILDTLPPLPYVAHEILVAVNSQQAGLAEIAGSLGREPGLAARVISMANSAFFADQRPLFSIEDAVVRLGLNRVRVLAASLLLARQFDGSRCRPFQPDRYWTDAVGTAFCAARLSRHPPAKAQQDLAYLAGLLHNIGLLLLVHVFPDEMSAVLAARARSPEATLPALTRQALGLDHHAAGRLLLSEWALPDELGTVAEHVHEAGYRGVHAPLVRLIHFCSDWAGTGFAEPCPATDAIRADALAAVGLACRREQAQLDAFARLLAGA